MINSLAVNIKTTICLFNQSVKDFYACKMQVLEGADEKKGICLACKLIADGNLELRLPGKWQKQFVTGAVSENKNVDVINNA